MKFWDDFIDQLDEFLGWLCGDDEFEQSDLAPPKVATLVETDSNESW